MLRVDSSEHLSHLERNKRMISVPIGVIRGNDRLGFVMSVFGDKPNMELDVIFIHVGIKLTILETRGKT